MVHRLLSLRKDYPYQFWLLFWGLLISTICASLIWPLLIIYVSERLELPLIATASLMTLNAAYGLAVGRVAFGYSFWAYLGGIAAGISPVFGGC